MNTNEAIKEMIEQSLPKTPFPMTVPAEPTTEDVSQEEQVAKEDYELARNTLYSLLEQMTGEVPDMLSVMSDIQNDKMYTAAASYMKAVADTAIQISKLSSDRLKKKTVKDSGQAQTINNNAVFLGSTEDFLRLLSKEEKDASSFIEGEFSTDVE